MQFEEYSMCFRMQTPILLLDLDFVSANLTVFFKEILLKQSDYCE